MILLDQQSDIGQSLQARTPFFSLSSQAFKAFTKPFPDPKSMDLFNSTKTLTDSQKQKDRD